MTPAPQGRPLRRCLPESAGYYKQRRALRALGELNPRVYTKQLWLTPRGLKCGNYEVLYKGQVSQWLTRLIWHEAFKKFCLAHSYSGTDKATVIRFPNLGAAREAFCREAQSGPFGGQHAKP